jgi:hypothetical protein
MADDDAQHARLQPDQFVGREQGDAGDDARQGDRQDEQQGDSFLAENAPIQRGGCRCPAHGDRRKSRS